ncbi:MAG TPA: FIST N-terminal domain-containing protein, partial [Burkholderiaceae bacterium]|nr:FIST N-terminal domain-containing protein [Burkholderiaceae bacterium]
MQAFLHAHATHPDWRIALALAAAQLDAQAHAAQAARRQGSIGVDGARPTLGWVYLTEHYAAHAEALLAELHTRWPGVAWVGATGVGVAASGVEYFDDHDGALVLMLAAIPATQFRVFSGARPLRDFAANAALVHADPATPDLPELVHDMARRTASGYLFGGLASARASCRHIAEAVLTGGLSGVAFSDEVAIVSRVTQGCQPVGPTHEITAAERNVITELDGRPALDCLLRDVQLEGREPRDALPRLRQILVGLSDPPDVASVATGAVVRGAFGDDVRVRHLIGLDPGRRGIAIGDVAEPGTRLAFCSRNTEAARRDLVRICAEVREETEPEFMPQLAATPPSALPDAGPTTGGIAGAIYVSCAGRGGPHFGAPSAELA